MVIDPIIWAFKFEGFVFGYGKAMSATPTVLKRRGTPWEYSPAIAQNTRCVALISRLKYILDNRFTSSPMPCGIERS